MGLLQRFKDYCRVLQEEDLRSKREDRECDDRARETKRLQSLLSNVRFFPGNIYEYQRTVGHDVQVVDTGNSDMGVTYHGNLCLGSNDTLSRLIENNVEAIVNCQQFQRETRLYIYDFKYGLPVKRA